MRSRASLSRPVLTTPRSPPRAEVRGPKAARIYADAMAKARQPDEQAAAAKTEDLGTAPSQDAAAAGAGVDFSPNPYLAQQRTDGAQEQQVYVLRDGFGGWQSLHKVRLRESVSRG